MPFEFFDPSQPVDISQRRLPHWYQLGATYFITFRTADSLPADVIKQWLDERFDWLRKHGMDPTANEDWQIRLHGLPKPLQREFHSRFTSAFHRYLDAGYGECLLKQPALGELVAECLRHFDGVRYHMGDFVVMPNHVHLLVCLRGETKLTNQCYSWKKYTATQINKTLGRHGHFWQGESFDHLVRSPEQFAYFQNYIAENPEKARLREGEYYLYRLPQ